MLILSIFQGLLTPLIAVIAAYIAWQQWKLNHDRLAYDLYDRRLGAYKEVKKILSIIMAHAKATDGEMLAFIAAVSESDFLFGDDIIEYNRTLYQKGINLSYLNRRYSSGIKGEVQNYDNEKTVEEMHEVLHWFTKQFDPAKNLYGKYLKIDRKR